MFNLFNYLFPGTCVFCGLPSKRKQDLCLACEQNLPWRQTPVIQLKKKIIAPFYYQHPIDNAIISLKFANKLIYAKILGELLGKYLKKRYKNHNLPEVIIPVPLHKKRLQERGFNQALELARYVATQLEIPLDYTSCIRSKYTEAQSRIPAENRKKNVKKAFTVKRKIYTKHVAIIDDVITTGNTINEFCRTLHRSDIKNIDIWCCAKTK